MEVRNESPTITFSALPREEMIVVQKLCEEFEERFAADGNCRIADLLVRANERLHPVLLRELIGTALELLTSRGVIDPWGALRAANPELTAELDAVKAEPRPSDTLSPSSTLGPKPNGLQVRCPHCHNPVRLVPDAELESILCSACGSNFSLLSNDEPTRHASGVTQVGHFKLIERVGMGAFGAVWKAHDTKLDRTVAVKIPRAGQLDSKEQEQFLREARTAAQLRHPNLVTVYEAGRDGETLYIVSDFVRGLTLSDWLTGQKPTFREAVTLCIKIAEALHHAHEKDVVHRDLKPGNIMLDGEGQPHLMDFGLARRDVGEVTVTVDGQVLGTPAYMSPEQAAGEGHQADRRTDIYSLGVILYQLLTGELPFRGNARMLMHQVLHDEPPSPRKLNNAIPRDLETITLKCMEKEPAARYATAKEVAEDLTRWRQGEPIAARPIGSFTRAARWMNRHRSLSALAGASALFAVGFAVLSTAFVERQRRMDAIAAQASEVEEQRRIAVAAQREAEEQRNLTELARQDARREQALALVAEANAAIAEGDFPRSHMALEEAYRILREIGGDTRAADLVQAVLSERSPPRLLLIRLPERPECFAPFHDGRRLIAWWREGVGSAGAILDARTGSILQHIANRPYRVAACKVVPTDDRLAMCDALGNIEIVTLATGDTSSFLAGRQGLDYAQTEHTEMALSPDGETLAWQNMETNDRSRRKSGGIFRLDGELIRRDSSFATLAFDSKGQTCLFGDHVIEVASGALLKSLTLDEVFVSAAFCDADRVIVMGSWSGRLVTYDAATGEQIVAIKPHRGLVHGLRVSPDGTRLLSMSQDGTLMVWDVDRIRTLADDSPQVLYAGEQSQWRAEWITDDLVASLDSHGLSVWHVGAGPGACTVAADDPEQLTFSPDGKLLLMAQNREEDAFRVDLVDTEVDKISKHVDLRLSDDSGFLSWQLSNGITWWLPDGQSILLRDNERLLRIDLALGTIVKIYKPPPISSLWAVDQSGELLATGGESVIDVWKLNSGAHLVRFGVVEPIFSIQFSETGDQVAWLDGLGLHSFDLVNRRCDLSDIGVEHSDAAVGSVRWHGEQLVITTHALERSVGKMDIKSKEYHQLDGHQRGIFACAVDDERDLAVSSSYDSTLRFWDVRRRRALLRLQPFDPSPVALAPGASRLAVGLPAGGVRIWDLDWAASLDGQVDECRLEASESQASSRKLSDLAKAFAYRGAWRWAIELEQLSRQGATTTNASRLEWMSELALGRDKAASVKVQSYLESPEGADDLIAKLWASSLKGKTNLIDETQPEPPEIVFEAPREANRWKDLSLTGPRDWGATTKIDWRQAADHVGKRVIVQGEIVRVGATSNWWFLNFSEKIGDFTVVVPASAFRAFPNSVPAVFHRENVAIVGEVILHKGTPEIVLESPDHIRIVDSAMARQ